MNLIFLTTDDPIYLPAFFEKVLRRTNDTVQSVCIVPPLYRDETPRAAALKYLRTFGLADFLGLSYRVAACKLRRQSIARTCAKHGVPCRHIANVNDPAFLDGLEAHPPDVLISVSCPQIFQKRLIAIPRHGILNIHGALLPQYRGVMPGFWMMANGEKTAGVSIYLVNEKIDAGDLCAQEAFPIRTHESLDEFLHRSKAIAAELLLNVLRRIKKNSVRRQPLNLTEGSYYSWPDRAAVERFRRRGRRVW